MSFVPRFIRVFEIMLLFSIKVIFIQISDRNAQAKHLSMLVDTPTGTRATIE